MYFKSIEFRGCFPNGDLWVEVSMPSGGGGNYHLVVDKFHWGIIIKYKEGWRVVLQNPNSDYTAGDLQPLIDLIV